MVSSITRQRYRSLSNFGRPSRRAVLRGHPGSRPALSLGTRPHSRLPSCISYHFPNPITSADDNTLVLSCTIPSADPRMRVTPMSMA
ncbi:hypothetical protein BB8028_0001g13480 [Beauveria bassiana]|uniref:Uncharacterized protein n=1 Tax=Beauveria bassiana TaxID=176275 RepID=A0A2S7XZK7_BEABA|nr:hypothetical protein BB8028_0001g13480 [Beauveria bassiana]